MPVFIRDCTTIDIKLARRKAVVEPSIIVPQGYQNRLQHLIPIYLTNMKKPDLAMTLSVMYCYYLGNTCLTLEMVYLNARMIARADRLSKIITIYKIRESDKLH